MGAVAIGGMGREGGWEPAGTGWALTNTTSTHTFTPDDDVCRPTVTVVAALPQPFSVCGYAAGTFSRHRCSSSFNPSPRAALLPPHSSSCPSSRAAVSQYRRWWEEPNLKQHLPSCQQKTFTVFGPAARVAIPLPAAGAASTVAPAALSLISAASATWSYSGS
ncbi:hypothetical protein GALMADRAFT_143288 [Galerina marginata CBS 339.88]|uniref:Uncharacterized protein n=1 Tax=Galerina marginata (strain CBS 339.88) TaxID=685588 RepID=A0A067SR36_GALM3|nr:hypothetical protein GALMADRAFT_143288 [Galerina marginata CBS 339.88]